MVLCSIAGCSVKSGKGKSLFQIPTKDPGVFKQWKDFILLDRVLDPVLARQLETGEVRLCERHFNPEVMWEKTSSSGG